MKQINIFIINCSVCGTIMAAENRLSHTQSVLWTDCLRIPLYLLLLWGPPGQSVQGSLSGWSRWWGVSTLLDIQDTALCQVPALWASCLSSLDSPSFYLPHLFYAHSWASSSRPVTLNSTHTTNDSITNPPSQSLHLYQKWVSNMTSRKISPRVFTAVNSITQLLRPQTQEPPIHLPVEGLLPLTHTHNHKWKLLLCQCSC
jgi:hypothetical protein